LVKLYVSSGQDLEYVCLDCGCHVHFKDGVLTFRSKCRVHQPVEVVDGPLSWSSQFLVSYVGAPIRIEDFLATPTATDQGGWSLEEVAP